MSKVITFSRQFPAYHRKKGEPTRFVEKIWQSIYLDHVGCPEFENLDRTIFDIGLHDVYKPKHHTIRAGSRWKVGDKFSPRVWSGKPYQSKQIIIAPDIEIKKVWDFTMEPSNFIDECGFFIGTNRIYAQMFSVVAQNDGLSPTDFATWFCGSELMSSKRKPFDGQIICWNENIQY